MRLASVEVIPYALPFKEPYVTARGRLDQREMVLLRLRSEDGVVGLGEAVPLSLRGGPGLADVVDELGRLGERDSLDEATLQGDVLSLSAPARNAALTALLDLRGRWTAATEGSTALAEAGAVECNATLSAGDPAVVAAEASRWAEDGFETFKLKLGTSDDFGQVFAVREAVGPRARIRIDANAAWDVETAKQMLRSLEPLEIELAEQPVETLEEAAEVTASTSIPIAGDESIESRADAERARETNACALTGIKLSKVGGPEAAIEIAEVLPAYLSSALDGPVGIAAAAQVAQTLQDVAGADSPGLAHGLATQRLFASTIASVECELRDGKLYPPPGPGLGVEIDEDALAAHRL
ncbi:MAG TPA: mandelate racemase/muconate lactonizing enzyme family protein [Solirubrobacterales bacterium]|nr:mandelate racemase/muconate lactonizing enzyme family protein [Solirubrobacterales bacterium]